MKKLIPLLLLIVLVFTAGCDMADGPITISGSGRALAISSFDASPSTVSAGEIATLSWNVSGASTVSIDQGIGNVALTGRRDVMPSATTVYTLTATNAAGMSATATAQVMVSGTPSPSAGQPVVISFTASPSGITAGSPATLSWNVSNATSVSIAPGVGTFASSGTTIVAPAVTTTYTLTATNAAGSTTAMAQVTVSGAAPSPFGGLPVVSSFMASPPIIPAGGDTTLSWNVSNAASVSIAPGVGAVDLVGTALVSPAASTDYTLTATNAAGVYYMTIPVLVTGVAPPAGEPDLIIEDISRADDKISYVIKNQGGVAAGASTSTLRVDGAVAANDSVAALAPGESRTETFTGYAYACTLPADTVEVRADTGGAVTEGSEANNSYSESWSCLVVFIPLLQPDLVIEDVWRVSEITGEIIHYRIKNNGGAEAGLTTTALYKYPCPHPCLVPVATDVVLPLAAGASREEKFAGYNYSGVGPPFGGVKVEADFGKDRAESDETNNTFIKDDPF
ncbi:CARDB domain-containing protein [Chloroflexota bacterium]